MTTLRVRVFALLAMCNATTPVFGQAHVLEGNVLPMEYDGEGGRHYLMYGYYGPHDPPMPHESKMKPRIERSPVHRVVRRHRG
jgi:hypothetical protein